MLCGWGLRFPAPRAPVLEQPCGAVEQLTLPLADLGGVHLEVRGDLAYRSFPPSGGKNGPKSLLVQVYSF